jgi:SHS2 domain-containing protein
LVEREIEVKAVTMHELLLREVVEGEVLAGVGNDIPSFEGPGWVAQVVLDV